MAAAASNQAAYTTGAQLQLTQPQGHTGQTVTVHVPLQTLQQHQQLGQATQMIQVQTAAATAAVAGQSLNITLKQKVFQCNFCNKSYPRKQSLQAHIIQVHTDKKPYECKLCSKGFVRRWDFYRHVNSVHRENASDALEPGKSEEYLAWMRGRRSATDISWECLNAVRPEGTTSNSASVSGTIDALTLSGLVNATELTVATASGSSATLNLNSLSGLTSADLLPGKPEEGELPIMKSESASIINHQQKLSHSENLVDSITERQILLGLTTSVSIDSSAAVTGRSGLIAAGSGVLVGSVDGVSGSISSSRDLGNGTSIANGLELTGNQTTAATSLLSSHNSASAPAQTSSAEHQQLIAPGSAAVAQASLLEASTITVNLTASGLVEHSATHG